MFDIGGPVSPVEPDVPSSPIELGGPKEEDPGPRPRPRDDDGSDEELRERAERAEARIVELESAIVMCERARELDGRLRDAGAIDLEIATTMALSIMERASSESDGEPVSVADAVGELKRTKPFLFAGSLPGTIGGGAVGGGSAMSGVSGAGPGDLDRLAERARASGDRRLLMRYLRQRRDG